MAAKSLWLEQFIEYNKNFIPLAQMIGTKIIGEEPDNFCKYVLQRVARGLQCIHAL